jgi:hypothetical protein
VCAGTVCAVHALCPTFNLIIMYFLPPLLGTMSPPSLLARVKMEIKTFLTFPKKFSRRSGSERCTTEPSGFEPETIRLLGFIFRKEFHYKTGVFGDCRQQFVEQETQSSISTPEK